MESIDSRVVCFDSDLKRNIKTVKILNDLGFSVESVNRPYPFPGEKSAVDVIKSENGTPQILVINGAATKAADLLVDAITHYEKKGIKPHERIILIGSCHDAHEFVAEYGINTIPSCGGGHIDPNNSLKTSILEKYIRRAL